MLKLYYSPGACSISPHIVLREVGVPFEPVRVDFMRGRRTDDGRTLIEVNPKNSVPALLLDDGQVLTEGSAIVQYIADLKPEAGLAPKPGTFERVRLQEWLNFIATELHKGLSPLYAKEANDEYKQFVKIKVGERIAFIDKSLEGKKHLMGDSFTVADAYAFYVLRASQRLAGAVLPPTVRAYYERIVERPSVRETMRVEGLT